MNIATKVMEKERFVFSPIERTRALFVQPSEETLEASLQTAIANFESDMKKLDDKKVAVLAVKDRPDELRAFVNTLTPAERTARTRILNEAELLKTETARSLKSFEEQKNTLQLKLRDVKQHKVISSRLVEKYPMVKISEVEWLDQKNKPLLFPLHLDKEYLMMQKVSKMYGGNTFSWKNGGEDRSYDQFSVQFREIFSPYISSFEGGDAVRVSFPGVIPLETKEAMARAKSDFDFLLLIADAETVLVEKIKDPLVVGCHYETPDLLWLVAAFDMTPIEQVITDTALKRFWEQRKKKQPGA